MKKLSILMLGLLLMASIKIFAQCNAQYTWALTPTGGQPLLVSFNNTSTFGSVTPSTYKFGYIDFGDGNYQIVGTGSTSHAYSAAGVYNTKVIIRTIDTSTNSIICSDSAFSTVTLSYSPCAASIAVQNNTGGSYTFTATSLAGTSGLTYSWNFGDGTSATGNPVTHTYASNGTYHPTLTSVGAGCSDTVGYTISYLPAPTINCDSLTAAFSTNINGLSVGFSNNSTYNASIFALSAFPIADWYFGDGATSINTVGAYHTYSTAGSYNVTMINRWKDSTTGQVYCTDTVVSQVTVTNSNPVTVSCDSLFAHFTPYVSGLNVSFYNSSYSNASGPSPYLSSVASWNFGDGGSQYNTANASHTYATAGTYNVTMINQWQDSMTGQVYCTDTFNSQVTVTGSNPGNQVSCDSLFAQFTPNVTGLTVTFYNSSYSTGSNPYLSSIATWGFGDGTYQSNTVNAYHTYATAGTYNVTMINQWQDSITGQTYCTDTFNLNVTVTGSNPSNPGTVSCDSLFAHFTPYINGLNVGFDNTSYSTSWAPAPYIYPVADWYFGDGSYQLGSSYAYHSYAAPGTYTVYMLNSWKDSMTNQVYCVDSYATQITVSNPNYIGGYIQWDSSLVTYAYDSIKVWLIAHDTSANSLTAIDSVTLSGYYYNPSYQFNNRPAGDYLVKAAFLGQTPGTAGFLPTYHLSSVYWSSATNIAHTGGVTSGKNIVMQAGTVTSGPGFIGGNISMGAGKGTGTGVEGMQVYLRNASNQLIASSITDDAGNFSFSDIPVGSYSVYPEAINYNTTPYNTIAVTSSQSHITTIDFEQKDNLIYPKQNSTGISNITKADGLNIYPNPAKAQLIIENKNSLFNKVHIVNTLGQTIQENNLTNGINKIGLTQINSGIYYLLISGPNGSRTTKIIKE